MPPAWLLSVKGPSHHCGVCLHLMWQWVQWDVEWTPSSSFTLQATLRAHLNLWVSYGPPRCKLLKVLEAQKLHTDMYKVRWLVSIYSCLLVLYIHLWGNRGGGIWEVQQRLNQPTTDQSGLLDPMYCRYRISTCTVQLLTVYNYCIIIMVNLGSILLPVHSSWYPLYCYTQCMTMNSRCRDGGSTCRMVHGNTDSVWLEWCSWRLHLLPSDLLICVLCSAIPRMLVLRTTHIAMACSHCIEHVNQRELNWIHSM